MIPNNQKTSLLIPSQLPEFIRNDPSYTNFVAFLQAYYEWLETNGNVTDVSKNILNYVDIDNTSNDFVNYFYDEFLKYFPQEILSDKSKVIKIAKQLYQSKGTPDSFKFLFRILYNSDVDFLLTKDLVLKASTGKWYSTKSLNVLTTDTNFLRTSNYMVFGETTLSIAVIENVNNTGSKMEIFISNVERQFESGEFIRIVDSNKQDVYFLNGEVVDSNTPGAYVLRAKVVGQINNLKIINQGSKYQIGDPIVFYGGITSTTGVGASAYVTDVSSGSVQSITVSDGGYGYRFSPNTEININTVGATTQPSATVFSLNPTGTANVVLLPINTLAAGNIATIKLSSNNYSSNIQNFPNSSICASNTTLVNAFSFISFSTSPLSSISVSGGGVGIQSITSITASSLYPTANASYRADLANMGILAPIQILNGGIGYRNNDTILISGGPGFGAYANVISVNPANSNTITSVSYVYAQNTRAQLFPLGGMGYKINSLPSVNVSSANASAYGAVLSIPGVLGSGASFQSVVSGVGKVLSFSITNYGQDYSSVPSASFRVQDVIVSGVDINNLPNSGDLLFQSPNGTLASQTYVAYFDSISIISKSSNPLNSLYKIRLYNYSSAESLSSAAGLLYDVENSATFTISNYNIGRFVNGIITYGDGSASASVTFKNGLVTSQGQFIDSTGHLSSDDVLQSDVYNNYTYQILVQKEIAKYRKTLLGLLHPAGMKVFGRYVLSSSNRRYFHIQEGLFSGHTLSYYAGTPDVIATMVTNYNNVSNNIIRFTAVPSGTNIANIFFANVSTITLSSNAGDRIHSLVTRVIPQSNTIYLQSNTWLTFKNVASVFANSGTNTINILSLSGLYEYYKDKEYTDILYPLKDIIKVGDTVFVTNNTSRIVKSIDYSNNIITVTTNITNNTSGSLANISVVRPFVTNSAAHIKVFGPTGTVYIPELITEDGITLTTEDETIILLG